jgi:hypothetical protein
MAKSKIYTYQKFGDLLRDFLQEIAPDKIQPAALHEYTNLGVLDLCERLNSASAPDYLKTAVLNESSKTPTPVLCTSFTHSTKTFAKTTHGLTSSDVGKRLIASVTDLTTVTIDYLLTKIVSITNANAFVVADSFGEDRTSSGTLDVSYGVLPLTAYTTNKLDCDISTINLDKIIKIVDSVNGLVVPSGDSDIEGIAYFSASLPGNSMKQATIWYTQNGETVSFYKGTSVSAYGTLTMHYYEQPTLLGTSDPLTTYIDVRDKFIPLLFAIVKNLLYEQLQKQAPDSLTAMIAAKTADIRASNKEESAAIKDRAKK